MNKLLSAASAIGMLLAVNAAQAGEVMTDENLDAVTAGVATAAVLAVAQGVDTGTTGTFALNASNTSPTMGTAAASISASATPVGTAPHTLSLAAAASAP